MKIHGDEEAYLSFLPDPLKNLFFNTTPDFIAQNDQHLQVQVCFQLPFIATTIAKIGR